MFFSLFLHKLTANVLWLCEGGKIEVQMFNFAKMLHFCKTPVSGSLFFFVSQFHLFLLIISLSKQGQLSCHS
jgi:hypothetical protein